MGPCMSRLGRAGPAAVVPVLQSEELPGGGDGERRRSSRELLAAAAEYFAEPSFAMNDSGSVAVQLVLSDDIARRALLEFMVSEHAEENVLFFEEWLRLQRLPEDKRPPRLRGIVDE